MERNPSKKSQEIDKFQYKRTKMTEKYVISIKMNIQIVEQRRTKIAIFREIWLNIGELLTIMGLVFENVHK